MRLYELYTSTDRIDEISAKQAIAAGGLALAAYAGYPEIKSFLDKKHPLPQAQTQVRPPTVDKEKAKIESLSKLVVIEFDVNPALAKKIVKLAKKHEHPIFPKAEDLLSIIAIESRFNPAAVSQLKKDPAIGLTQIRPGVWGLDPKKLKKDMESQIKIAAEILDKYNKNLKDPESAVHAYNIGISSFKNGRFNYKYVDKFNQARDLFKKIEHQDLSGSN